MNNEEAGCEQNNHVLSPSPSPKELDAIPPNQPWQGLGIEESIPIEEIVGKETPNPINSLSFQTPVTAVPSGSGMSRALDTSTLDDNASATRQGGVSVSKKDWSDMMAKFDSYIEMLGKRLDRVESGGHINGREDAPRSDRSRSRSPIHQEDRLAGAESYTYPCSEAQLAKIHKIWPEVWPLWQISEEELGNIVKQPTPTLFYVPPECWCENNTLYFEEGLSFSEDEIFLGEWRGTPVVAFWSRTLLADQIMSELTTVKFGEEKFSVHQHCALTANMINWIDLEGKTWIPGRTKNEFTLGEDIQVDQISAESFKKFEFCKKEHPTPWFKFDAQDPATKDIASFLYADKLPEDCHLIPEIAQPITNPVDAPSRERDYRVRQRAAAFMNMNFSLQLINDTLRRLMDPSIEGEHKSSTLCKLQKFAEGTLQLSKPMSRHFLKDALFARSNCRDQACKTIKDTDIMRSLTKGDWMSPALFSRESVSTVSHKLERPAPRCVTLDKSPKKATKAHPGNQSKGEVSSFVSHRNPQNSNQWRGRSLFRGARGSGRGPGGGNLVGRGSNTRGSWSTSRPGFRSRGWSNLRGRSLFRGGGPSQRGRNSE